MQIYPVTTQNANNSSSEIDVLSFSMPANDWDDGETVCFDFATKTKQNSGSAATLTIKLKIDTEEATLANASSVSNSSLEGNIIRNYYMKRVGSDIYVWAGTANAFAPLFGSFTTQLAVISGIDFTQANTIAISAQWSVANANVYYDIEVARAIRY